MSSHPGGALGRITSETVLSSLALVRRGRVYDLGLEIDEYVPQGSRAYLPSFSKSFSMTPEGTGGAGSPLTYSAETIVSTLHISTHIDALIHVQSYGQVFGGAATSEVRGDQGWRVHGAETIPPIIGRCLLLDVAGPGEVLPDGYEVTVDDLREVLEARSLTVCSGDCVLVRTGKIHEFRDEAAFQAAEPGVGAPAAVWLYEQGMAVLGTDTGGTEPSPVTDLAATTHRAMLVERGVHLLENLYLDELSTQGVAEALFVCLPLKLTGCTGSWVRPVAIT
jgi:kynurenine formamidase